jgi:predicted HTH domain antitoxin
VVRQARKPSRKKAPGRLKDRKELNRVDISLRETGMKASRKQRRVQAALNKYSQGSVTLLKAAEIAGISVYEMIALLEEGGVPYRYDISDLEEYVKRRYG